MLKNSTINSFIKRLFFINLFIIYMYAINHNIIILAIFIKLRFIIINNKIYLRLIT